MSLAFSRGAVRLAALAGIVLTATVMVGSIDSAVGARRSRVSLAAGSTTSPVSAAFRTTNKAGAGLVLAAAVAVAAATERVLRPAA